MNQEEFQRYIRRIEDKDRRKFAKKFIQESQYFATEELEEIADRLDGYWLIRRTLYKIIREIE